MQAAERLLALHIADGATRRPCSSRPVRELYFEGRTVRCATKSTPKIATPMR